MPQAVDRLCTLNSMLNLQLKSLTTGDLTCSIYQNSLVSKDVHNSYTVK